MYSYIKGTLEEINPDYIVLECQNIGYEIRISGLSYNRLPSMGEPLKLYTFLHVKEDNIGLFGFFEKDELNVFKQLLTVSGVGPKGALGILSVLTANDLRIAVSTQDAKAISKAPGIGSKTAQRIIIDLKDKLKLEDALLSEETTAVQGMAAINTEKQEAIEALVALGYAAKEAQNAVRSIPEETLTVEEYLKKALVLMH